MGELLKGRVALVTGGSTGIGAATVDLFRCEGAKVLVADVRETQGGDGFIHCDVTREADIAAAVKRAQDDFGGIDILFSNAGAGGTFAPIVDMDVGDWEWVMSLNLRAAMLGIKHVAPIMKVRGGGSIINTSSIAALRPGISGVAYSVAKAANVQLTVMAAAELAPFNIRVNAICPGIIPAGSVGGMLGLDDASMERLVPEISRIFGTAQPLARAGAPLDIANAALFMASDMSTWMTGQAVSVDGGMMLKGPDTLDTSRPGNVVGQLFEMRDKDLAKADVTADASA